VVCEFCGKVIETRKFYGMTIPVPCDCMGACMERARLDEEEREQNIAETLREAVSRAQIPSTYNLYQEWGDGRGKYLYGPQGRGKTEMACGILRKWLRDGIKHLDGNRYYASRSAKYVLVPQLMMEMKATYGHGGKSELYIVEAMGGVGMLLLDDLGKGKLTEWAIERIFMVLDMRLRERRPTVITSNHDPDELTAMLAAGSDDEMALAIRSRIDGMCDITLVDGVDWREKAR
jgi:DNA replication protein DnaC